MLIPARTLGTAPCLSVTRALAATRTLVTALRLSATCALAATRVFVAALTLGTTAILAVTTPLAAATDPATAPPGNTSPAHEPPGFWTGPINSAVPATLAGGKVIHDARRLQTLLKRPGTVVIDVSNAPRRPDNLATGAPWLPLPHQAIPGSLWIPGAGLGEIPPPVNDFFRKQLAAATDGDLARRVVIYCHQTCWLSWNAAKRAIGYGYRNVYWYRDGIEGWKAAHFPTAVIEPRVAPEG
jgi:PQQ-dependent catabolism-associated CXXCW motif protein